jgi:hypothetical protein
LSISGRYTRPRHPVVTRAHSRHHPRRRRRHVCRARVERARLRGHGARERRPRARQALQHSLGPRGIPADISSRMARGVRSCTRRRAITGFDFSPLSTTTSSTPSAARRDLNECEVADHLVPTLNSRLSYRQGLPLTPGDARTVLRDILPLFGPTAYLTLDDLTFFGAGIWPILTSCKEFGSGIRADELVGVRLRRAARIRRLVQASQGVDACLLGLSFWAAVSQA